MFTKRPAFLSLFKIKKTTCVLLCPPQNDCLCYYLYSQPVFSHWTFNSDAWTWQSLCPQFWDNQNYWSWTLNYQRRTGQSVSQWTKKGHGKCKIKGIFARLPYFHFTVVFCGFKMEYIANIVVSGRLGAWSIWRRWSGNICLLFSCLEELNIVKQNYQGSLPWAVKLLCSHRPVRNQGHLHFVFIADNLVS